MKKKFRAYDTFTNKMIFEGFHLFGEVLTFSLLDQWCYENPNPKYSASLLRCNDIKIMQFTGLLDKNEKDIYEDDLLKDEYGTIFRVYAVAGGFVYKESVWQENTKEFNWTDLMVSCSFAQATSYIQQCEVVGNIYENIELLNKAKP